MDAQMKANENGTLVSLTVDSDLSDAYEVVVMYEQNVEQLVSLDYMPLINRIMARNGFNPANHWGIISDDARTILIYPN